MTRMSIRLKLRATFLCLAACFLAFGLLAIDRMATLNHFSTKMEANWIPSILLTGSMSVAIGEYRLAESAHILTTDDKEMAAWEVRLTRLEERIEKWRGQYEPLIDTDYEMIAYRSFQVKYADYLASSKKAVAISRRNDNVDANRMLRDSRPLFEAVNEDLRNLVEINRKEASEAGAESNRVFALSRKLIIIAIAVVVLAALVLAWILERAVSTPIERVAAAVARLAEGKLDGTVAGEERGDEVGRIARAVAGTTAALRSMVEDLNGVIGEARAGNLSVRADPTRHKGDFAGLLIGCNDLVETLTKPLVEVAQVMQKLAGGDLEGRVTGAYDGDLRALKANVNRSLDSLAGLLGELGALGGGLAAGDLRGGIAGNYQGAFAALKADINRGFNQLRELLSVVVEETGQVSVAATQTTAAARQVAQSSAEQMTTLTEVSGAIAQTAAAVNHVADGAASGGALARSAANLALSGRAELATLAEEVEQVAARHGRIDRITTTITRIADKTQVLSINAGIEAARAGDSGRGFGVVAHQIGRLAEEAAEAARDIGTLITEATDGVKRGVGGVAAARSTMEHIADAAGRSDHTAQSIASAITQQSSVVQLLAQRVQELRAAGQGNAGAAEEISATMEELARLVHRTQSHMARFVLD
ncbi:methyl-accepting chemotaxis protein [uncultured Gammaproteobacteria bacterium]